MHNLEISTVQTQLDYINRSRKISQKDIDIAKYRPLVKGAYQKYGYLKGPSQ